MPITLKLLLPICTVSEANQKGNWQAHFKRRAAQKQLAFVFSHNEILKREIDITVSKLTKITCIRHGKRRLDDDNLAGSFKHIIDGTANAFGVNDRNIRMFFDQTSKNGEPYTELLLELK